VAELAGRRVRATQALLASFGVELRDADAHAAITLAEDGTKAMRMIALMLRTRLIEGGHGRGQGLAADQQGRFFSAGSLLAHFSELYIAASGRSISVIALNSVS
jgi:hypothetical protein